LLQWEMASKFHNDPRLRFFIGDVRDKERLRRAAQGVDIIVHAAALKQVPACEYNPIEAVKTNIDGAVNIIDAAIDNDVEKVLAISTDKAVHPVNLYGATKMVMERLITQANVYAGVKRTRFACSRYGNVIGSRGSVVPLFFEQRKNGKITLTDERMTRFLLTLTQGVNFVIKCLEQMKGGEVFVPKIPSAKMIDLADVLAPEAQKVIIGIRPGERLHEVLLTEDEARHAREFDDYFIIELELSFWDGNRTREGRVLADGFCYASETNQQWLTREDMEKMIEEYHT